MTKDPPGQKVVQSKSNNFQIARTPVTLQISFQKSTDLLHYITMVKCHRANASRGPRRRRSLLASYTGKWITSKLS